VTSRLRKAPILLSLHCAKAKWCAKADAASATELQPLSAIAREQHGYGTKPAFQNMLPRSQLLKVMIKLQL
jgi:hypothetical protein